MGASDAEIFKFRKQSRKVCVCADRIAVDNDGIAGNSVGNDTIHIASKVKLFIVLQGEIGAAVLAVQV